MRKYLLVLALGAAVFGTFGVAKPAKANDTERDDFIQKCRLMGGSAITKFRSDDVYCATRPLKLFSVDQP